jgi:hypothetical protein
MSGSEDVVRQFSGQIPGMATGQNSVAKVYVDDELAIRDVEILTAAGVAANAQATADTGVAVASAAQSSANIATGVAQSAKQSADIAQTRVNNIIAHNGDGTKDTELIDARQPETGTAFPALGPRLNNLDAKLKDITINVLSAPYNSVGNGIADDGPALRAAASYLESRGGGTLLLPSGYTFACSLASYGGVRPAVIRLSSNVKVVMRGATLKLLPTVEDTSYDMIGIYDGVNCSVEGGTIIGNKHTSSAATGSSGMGLGLYGVTNFRADDVHLRELWGDGIYLGRAFAIQGYCKDVRLTNIVCDDNRRQGMSIISVRNLYVENFTATNTSGTDPQDGIDIEPNGADEYLENINLVNIYTANNRGSGIKFFLSNLDATSAPISITITNHRDESTAGITDSSFRVRKIGKQTKGFIHARNCTWTCNSAQVFSHEESSYTGIRVTLEDCQFYYYGSVANVHAIVSRGARFNTPPTNPADVEASTVGSLSVIRPRIYSKDGILSTNIILVDPYAGFTHRRFTLIDPINIDATVTTNIGPNAFAINNAENVVFSDKENILTSSYNVGTVSANTSRVCSEIENMSTSTGRGVTITAYAAIVGLVFTVKMAAADGVIVPGAAATIRGFALGQSVRANSAYSVTVIKVISANLFQIMSTSTTFTGV